MPIFNKGMHLGVYVCELPTVPGGRILHRRRVHGLAGLTVAALENYPFSTIFAEHRGLRAAMLPHSPALLCYVRWEWQVGRPSTLREAVFLLHFAIGVSLSTVYKMFVAQISLDLKASRQQSKSLRR
jgi:hypothetical protein